LAKFENSFFQNIFTQPTNNKYHSTGTTLATRPYSGIIEATRVDSLVNAVVDYETTIVGRANNLKFELEVITEIPDNGGIYIVAAKDFQFADNCIIVPNTLDDPKIKNLPTDVG
jgi:hypothetical protein